MQTQFKIADLNFVRAGSDFMGICWSCHIKGTAFQRDHQYTFENEDGSTYKVWAYEQTRFEDGLAWHMIDEDGAMMLMGA